MEDGADMAALDREVTGAREKLREMLAMIDDLQSN